jgi:hypothetical protein
MEYAIMRDRNGEAETIRQAKLFRAAAKAGRIKDGRRYRFEERSQSFVECDAPRVNTPKLSERTRFDLQTKIRRSEPPPAQPLTDSEYHRFQDRAIRRPDDYDARLDARNKQQVREVLAKYAAIKERAQRAKPDPWIA